MTVAWRTASVSRHSAAFHILDTELDSYEEQRRYWNLFHQPAMMSGIQSLYRDGFDTGLWMKARGAWRVTLKLRCRLGLGGYSANSAAPALALLGECMFDARYGESRCNDTLLGLNRRLGADKRMLEAVDWLYQ